VKPRWFFLPNFVWRPGLERILCDLGLEGALLDSRHYEDANSTRQCVGTQRMGESQLRASRASRKPGSIGGCLRLGCQVETPTCALHSGLGCHPSTDIRKPFRYSRTKGTAIRRIDTLGSGAGRLMVVADDGDRVRGSPGAGISVLKCAGALANWDDLLDSGCLGPPLGGASCLHALPAKLCTEIVSRRQVLLGHA